MLSGNLELFALADVLRFVARSGATGAVNIYRPSEGGRVLLSDGEIVGASIEAFEAADVDGIVEAGLRLLDGGGGDFALDIEDVDGPIRMPVEDFLKTVARRRAEWRKIIAAVGSLEEPLVIGPQLPGGTSEITLSALEWQIAVSSDGQRSLRDIAHELGTSDFSVATAVLAMSNAGLLSLQGADPSTEADDDEAGDGSDFDYREEDAVSPEAEQDEEPLVQAQKDEEDLDPAILLRELGEQQQAHPRARRLTPGSRQEQALRLRSR